MLKQNELSDRSSCWNRAMSDEMIFVLLARDKAAPVAIRAWVAERIRIHKNKPDDTQILEALLCAEQMEKSRYSQF